MRDSRSGIQAGRTRNEVEKNRKGLMNANVRKCRWSLEEDEVNEARKSEGKRAEVLD